MPNCVNPRCRQLLRDEFYFCPVCGTDNRPPARRKPVAMHIHQFERSVGCNCVWCGQPPEKAYAIGERFERQLAWLLAGVALILLLVCVFTLIATYAPNGGWASADDCTARERLDGDCLRNGWLVVTPCGALAVLMLIALWRLLTKAPLYSDDETDDYPLPYY